MPAHIFFDLDDTLTASRTPMKAEHIPLFIELCEKRDVIVISGAQDSQMLKQLPSESAGTLYRLTQNGNHAVAPDGSLLWSEKFSETQQNAVLAFIATLHDELKLAVKDEDDLIEIRGSQISYSLIGHNEAREIKKAFDPDASKRKALLASHTTDVDHLRELGIEVTAGGTTCFDIYLLGKNKGFHVANLISRMKWKKEDSVYVGDAIEPGRNDESVIGVIATHPVTGPDDTFTFIKQMLS